MEMANLYLYIVLYFIFDTSKCSSYSGVCNKSSGEFKCCTGYIWRQDRCVICPAGTYGNSCASVCPVGFYGIQCAENCDCEIKQCNAVTGCKVNVRKDEATIDEIQVTREERENDWTTEEMTTESKTTGHAIIPDPDRSTKGDQSLNIYIMAGSTGVVGILCIVIVIAVILKLSCRRRTTEVSSIYNTNYDKSKRSPSVKSNKAEVTPNVRSIEVPFSDAQNEYSYVYKRDELNFNTFQRHDSTYLEPIPGDNIYIHVENSPGENRSTSREQESEHVKIDEHFVSDEQFPVQEDVVVH